MTTSRRIALCVSVGCLIAGCNDHAMVGLTPDPPMTAVVDSMADGRLDDARTALRDVKCGWWSDHHTCLRLRRILDQRTAAALFLTQAAERDLLAHRTGTALREFARAVDFDRAVTQTVTGVHAAQLQRALQLAREDIDRCFRDQDPSCLRIALAATRAVDPYDAHAMYSELAARDWYQDPQATLDSPAPEH